MEGGGVSINTNLYTHTGEEGLRFIQHNWVVLPNGNNYTQLGQTNGEGDGTPLQHSCLENPMDRGAWWAADHGIAKSQTRLSDLPFTFHFHALEKAMVAHSSVLAWKSQGQGSLVGFHL